MRPEFSIYLWHSSDKRQEVLIEYCISVITTQIYTELILCYIQ